MYKNFDEIKRKVWRTIEKILRKLKKKKWSVFNIYWNFEKNSSFLRNFYLNFGNLLDSEKILDKSGIKLSKFYLKLNKLLS